VISTVVEFCGNSYVCSYLVIGLPGLYASAYIYFGVLLVTPVESMYAEGMLIFTDVEAILSLYIQSLGFTPPLPAHLIHKS
jgi:hypothetical protein